MPTINQFVNVIIADVDFEPKEIEVIIDTKFYPCEFGINVKPLLVVVKSGDKTKSYNVLALNELFKASKEAAPEGLAKNVYLLVKETKHRRLNRCPQSIVIDPLLKEYEGNKFYNYKIYRLCLMNEVERYEKIRKNAYALLKDNKEDQKSSDSNGEEELPPEMLE